MPTVSLDADIRITKASLHALYRVPTVALRAQAAGATVVASKTVSLRVQAAALQVVCKAYVAPPHVKVWTFTLDDHDFVVVNLYSETLIYDLHAGTWMNWGTRSSKIWRALHGCNWNANLGTIHNDIGGGFSLSNVLVGDYVTGALYLLNAELPEDVLADGSTEAFQRHVYGQIATRSRDAVSCPAVSLTASIGEGLAAADMGVTLYISDDRGHGYVSAGTIEVSQGDYSPLLDWRSLGSFVAPGRLFKIEDYGALTRIDGVDMPDAK